MRRSYLVIGGAIVALAVVLILWLGGGGGDSGKKKDTTGDERASNAPALSAPKDQPSGIDEPIAPGEADPKGTLLMEGQVLGDDDQPVGKADVWISSVPPQHAVTEDDGGFHFDGLLPH